ncbi:mannanase [Mycena albidolilacea]|uniref:mannan endo-1,4-beta-mannosidase n=1 Tax=Mycena albidolilacea TaxID=1033008 RepID=A0AAD6Z3B8_9AGAR|nr:mannanase [Mycena albidolilacea]
MGAKINRPCQYKCAAFQLFSRFHQIHCISVSEMHYLVFLAVLFAGSALATVQEWGQCGGSGYTGDTVCTAPFVCTVLNDFFFQCLPAGSGTSTVSSSTTTTNKSTSTSTSKTTTSITTTSTPAGPSATGFVKTSGTKFTLNGAPFTVVGENAYWPALLGYSPTDNDKAFADIAASGATTVRTMAFNEVTSPVGVYYHLWNGSTATVNTGPNGLQTLDILIASAKTHGLRLIIALTNNWSDFGGMDVYTTQLLGPGHPHDTFYTNPTVIAAYKTYVQAIVSRYVNETAVMAWELANEPCCAGNTPASATCNSTTISTWAANISAFIKSIDKNHLVAIGDEGFINAAVAHNFDYPYQGDTIGVDFAENMGISTLDFGTFHMYPDNWGHSADDISWGNQWITDHATIMKSANKPVIMEEYGLTSSARTTIYPMWYNTVISSGLTGDLVWEAGSVLSTGETPNQGYEIYPTDPAYKLLQAHAAALKARDGSS